MTLSKRINDVLVDAKSVMAQAKRIIDLLEEIPRGVDDDDFGIDERMNISLVASESWEISRTFEDISKTMLRVSETIEQSIQDTALDQAKLAHEEIVINGMRKQTSGFNIQQ